MYKYLTEKSMPLDVLHIKREHVESFILWQLEQHKPSTALTRYRACHVFFNWLVEEGEIKENPMRLMQRPKVVETSPEILTEQQLKAILDTCKGNNFEDWRDTAIIRVLIDTPLRRAELTNIRTSDIDWKLNVIHIEKVKRGGSHSVPFGRKTAVALDRYLRIRARHKDNESPNLWIGKHGAITGFGIFRIVQNRCKDAGVEDVYIHLFRHTFANNWLAAGGREGDLMAIGNWHSNQVMRRYTSSQQKERARKSHAQLGPGDRI